MSVGSYEISNGIGMRALLASDWASAQDQAQQSLQQQQWQQEQTRRGYQAQQDAYAAQQQEMPPPPPRPTGEWIKTWGAIAAEEQSGDTGVAIGKRTRKEAEIEAVNQCLSWGGKSCKPTLVYHNQCAAIAVLNSNSSNGRSASASSVELAKEVAVQSCSKANGEAACKVVYSACSEPIFKRY